MLHKSEEEETAEGPSFKEIYEKQILSKVDDDTISKNHLSPSEIHAQNEAAKQEGEFGPRAHEEKEV